MYWIHTRLQVESTRQFITVVVGVIAVATEILDS